MTDTVSELREQLHALHQRRDEELRSNFNRSLPFADAQFDRWERAKILGFGEKTSIYDSCVVMGEVSVGRNSWIGPYTMLDGSGGGLTIGDFVSVSTATTILAHHVTSVMFTGDSSDLSIINVSLRLDVPLDNSGAPNTPAVTLIFPTQSIRMVSTQ